jgi:hypothetical protein
MYIDISLYTVFLLWFRFIVTPYWFLFMVSFRRIVLEIEVIKARRDFVVWFTR